MVCEFIWIKLSLYDATISSGLIGDREKKSFGWDYPYNRESFSGKRDFLSNLLSNVCEKLVKLISKFD